MSAAGGSCRGRARAAASRAAGSGAARHAGHAGGAARARRGRRGDRRRAPLRPPPETPAPEPVRERRPAPAAPAAPVPPAWVRFLLWLVAVPIAFLMVFGIARAAGFLTTSDITDVALAEGWRRFMPIVRLLPFVAIVTALIVTGGVYGLARMRAQSAATPAPGPRPKSRPPRQSSRAGA